MVLQLTEKEINFLILFSQKNQPLSRNFILQNVWNYSSKSDTHTVETHIHRLRKKFLAKFKDSNFYFDKNIKFSRDDKKKEFNIFQEINTLENFFTNVLRLVSAILGGGVSCIA